MLPKATRSSPIVVLSSPKALIMKFPLLHAHALPNESPIVIVKTFI
jgi:hypothetical protein